MIYKCEQYSDEWYQLRCGKVTASMVWAVTKKLKGRKAKDGTRIESTEEATDRRYYRERLLAETLTGVVGDSRYITKEMEWGMEWEPVARASYEVESNGMVDKVGFVTHDAIPRFGCSPDSYVGDDGLAQFKCPNTTTHLNYVLDGVVPEEYEPQMVAEMACTGRQWCDFVSFDPRLPAGIQKFTKRLERDETRVKEVEAAVLAFLAELDVLVAKLNGQEPTLEARLAASLAAVREEIPEPF